MTSEDIIQEVCDRMGVDDLNNRRRSRDRDNARAMICYLLHESGMTWAEVAKEVDRTPQSVQQAARMMRLWVDTPHKNLPLDICREMLPKVRAERVVHAPAPKPPKDFVKPRYSDEEVALIKALYPTTSTEKLAAMLGRAASAVSSKARLMGIKKERLYRSNQNARNADKAVRNRRAVKAARMSAKAEVMVTCHNLPQPTITQPTITPQPKPKPTSETMLPGPRCVKCAWYPCFEGIDNMSCDFAQEGCVNYHEKERQKLNAI